MMDRVTLFRAMIEPGERGLEIGPGYNPMFPKRDGFNVETVDHGTGDELRAKYAFTGAAGQIEDVDYVWQGQLLHELVGKEAAYDFIFSSHCLEHVPDPVGHIQSCERLLKPGGRIILALPDMRYCFDALRNPSSTGDFLASSGRSTHSPAAVFDWVADFCRIGGIESWTIRDRGALQFHHTRLDGAKELFDRSSVPTAEYIDVHGWTFTPASYRLVIADLRAMGLIRYGITSIGETDHCDFHVVMKADAPTEIASRIVLKQNLIKETAMNAVQLLGGSDELRARIHKELLVEESVVKIN